MEDRLLTVQEVAKLLRLDPQTVRRWLARGQIQGKKFGSDRAGWRVAESEVRKRFAELSERSFDGKLAEDALKQVLGEFIWVTAQARNAAIAGNLEAFNAAQAEASALATDRSAWPPGAQQIVDEELATLERLYKLLLGESE